MEAFCSDESFGAEFVAVGVAEDDTSEGSTAGRSWCQFSYLEVTDYLPTRVMDDVLYDTTNVSVAFCIVQITESSRGFSVVGVCFELEND